MEEKKMLNEEELEKVNGGSDADIQDRYVVADPNARAEDCDYYQGFVHGPGARCRDCNYFRNPSIGTYKGSAGNSYCTNENVINKFRG